MKKGVKKQYLQNAFATATISMIDTNGSATSDEPNVDSMAAKSCGTSVPSGPCRTVSNGGGPTGGKPALIGPVTAKGHGVPSRIRK